ncbi:MAG: hypothetical protein DMG13_20020 [Acidobacteria bacterium]|nr:MAG: hypothetical protein DMG13_20020 [Acidobacteriota bacterium]
MAVLDWMGLSAGAQARSRPARSATRVAAEMTRGRLSPTESKAGDQIALRLKEDLRSNGDVVLKRGTTITGVIRTVKKLEPKQNAAQARSLIGIEWFAPASVGKAVREVSIALQSITQLEAPSGAKRTESPEPDFEPPGVTAGPSKIAANSANRESGELNLALLNMPSVVAANPSTAANLESTLGISSSSGQLFKVGHGEWTTRAGSKQSVEIFSHLKNDSVIISQSKKSSGAQMQLLVGVNKK